MAWDIISTLNAPTSGAFTFTGLSLSGRRVLSIELDGIRVTTDGTDIRLTFYVSGSEITTNSYEWQVDPFSSSGSTDPDELTATNGILLTQNSTNWDVGNAATKSFSGRVFVFNPGSTTKYKRTSSLCSAIGPTTNVIQSQGSGMLLNAGAIDGLKLGGTSNLTAGTVRLLGIA